jgi:hypothetical protein
MRRMLRAGLVGLATLTVVGTTQLAGVPASGATSSTNTAYQAKLRFDAARQARMVARRLAIQAGGVHITPGAAAPAVPSLFGTAVNTERISRDTLHGPPPSQDDTQAEPDMAMDPNNSNVVIGVFQQGRFQDGGSVDPGFASSQDGGKTWTRGDLPGLTVAVGGPFQRASDPAVAFGPDGAAYVTTIPFDATSCRTAVSSQRSDDGGLTWTDAVFPTNENDCSVFNDKNWVAVDTFAASPFYGRVYLPWSRFHSTGGSPGVLQYSDDRGQTWGDIERVTPGGSHTEGLIPLVHPNGHLTMVFDAFAGKEYLQSSTSTDGGDSWSPTVNIARFKGTGLPDERTGGLPAAAIDPTTDTIYAVWQDTRFRDDGLNDIVITQSTDEGATWSPLRRVNVDGTSSGIDHFTPDVSAHGGFVHVTYLTRNFNGVSYSNIVRMRYIHSEDGGTTFQNELTIGPPSDVNYSARAAGAIFYGDYIGSAAGATTVHVDWNFSGPNPFDPNATKHQTTWSSTILK